jgi:hypothetical protein
MNIVFLPLALLFLASSNGAYAADDSRLKAVDALLLQARPLVARFEETVNAVLPVLRTPSETAPDELTRLARKRLQENCSSDFSINVKTGRKKSFPTAKMIHELEPYQIGGMLHQIQRYYECEAFMQRKPDLCLAMARYQSATQPDETNCCLISYVRSSVIQMNVTGRPDAAKTCESLPFPPFTLDGRSPREECAWMTSKEPRAGCKNALDPTLQDEEAKDCLTGAILRADESVCAIIKDAPLPPESQAIYKERCDDMLGLRKAYPANDPELCGDSLVCRMMMGEKVCDRRLAIVKDQFCSLWSRHKTPETAAGMLAAQESLRKKKAEALALLKERRSQLDGLFAQAAQLLEDFEPKSEPGYISRQSAYKALRQDFAHPLEASREGLARTEQPSSGK